MVERWVVIGAGAGGCVAAARLSERADREVVLLEAGPPLEPAGVPEAVAGPDFLAALASEGRVHAGLRARLGSVEVPYPQGAGVGGSSAVNAMVVGRGDPARYRSWGWDGVDDAWRRVAVPAERAGADELGPIDRALLAAAPDAGTVELTRRDGRRVTAAEAYLWPARGRDNLRIRPGSPVDRLLLDGRRVSGVRMADGTEEGADRVVLSAGAIHTPAILQRSGIRRQDVGSGLRDHPSASFTLELAGDVERPASGLCVGTALHRDGLQVLPMNHTTPGGGDPYGALAVAVLRPAGTRGSVRAAGTDPAQPPVIELPRDRRDVDALRGGVRLVLDLLAAPAFADVVSAVYVDEHGSRAATLRDDRQLDDWLRTASGSYVHPTGTCAIGAALDDTGRLDGYDGVMVCDASVFPDIPDSGTYFPTLMAAERLAARW